MSHNNLLDYLTDIIASQLARQDQLPLEPQIDPLVPFDDRRIGLPAMRGGLLPRANLHRAESMLAPSQAPAPVLTMLARNIATNLLEQALKSGLPFDLSQFSEAQLKDGNTAEVVAHITLHLPFVFKLEMNGETVKNEAHTMRAIKNNRHLNEDFRNAWATVYAIYEQGPPHAYLMEFFPEKEGWQSLQKRMYANPRPAETCVSDWVNKVVDLLFEGYYSSVAPRSRPNLSVDYCARIAPRLQETEELEKNLIGGNFFASRTLEINGKRYKPWREYTALLARHTDYLDRLTPPFMTVVHGDPNPGNFMLKLESHNSRQVMIKLIDPKDWEHGDYLLDIAKLNHFLQVVGPAEYSANGNNPVVTIDQSEDVLALRYTLEKVEGVNFAIETCIEKVRQFAHSQGDTSWQARYEFAMAANLLGLPLGRLKNNKLYPALIFLAEGIIQLDQFCERLEPGFRLGNSVRFAPPNTFEPPFLQQERLWLQQHIAALKTSKNSHGYPQLRWAANGDATRFYELSFEHQARLSCNASMHLGALQSALRASADGKQVFLPGTIYKDLIVKRTEQNKPCVAHYYDYADHSLTLCNQQICLSERIETDDKLSAWQLELPFVALASTCLRARLAYHWQDLRQQRCADSLNQANHIPPSCHPLALAAQRYQIDLSKLQATLQLSTYRETFQIQDTAKLPLFAISLDHVVAQSLASGSIGSYVEIEIACMVAMDEQELPHLSSFVATVAKQYHLVDNQRTSAQRGAYVVGLIAQR